MVIKHFLTGMILQVTPNKALLRKTNGWLAIKNANSLAANMTETNVLNKISH